MMQIYITTQFEGIHKWDNAPDEVKFLRYPHRHLFNVKVWFSVNHDDRDLEFFIMKRKLNNYILASIDQNDVGSCEMVCRKIAEMDSRITKVEVNEDNENGAVLQIK
jgi:hypothetical protein